MLRTLPARLGTFALVVIVAAACAKPDARPAVQNVAASGGDVVPSPASATPASGGMTPGLTDSTSAQADRGRIRGAATAPIWLVEVSDFQCPYCKQWHDEVFATLDKEYVQTGKVRLAYLNYPIPQLHPNARAASEAAMCASVQGKFWQLHESLFNTQKQWAGKPDPMPSFDSLATAAGVDGAKWRSCMGNHAAVALIEADHERSRIAGVQSTPTFFVGDRMILGALPVDTFRVAIEAALAKARAGH